MGLRVCDGLWLSIGVPAFQSFIPPLGGFGVITVAIASAAMGYAMRKPV